MIRGDGGNHLRPTFGHVDGRRLRFAEEVGGWFDRHGAWAPGGAGFRPELARAGRASTGYCSPDGAALVPKLRPSLAAVTTQRPSESGDHDRDVERQQLIVGWRTWYGPAYVGKYGRDFLLGLPDRAEPLPDGGVYHQLEASALTMIEGPAEAYARLWSYLAGHHITPVWPRPPRRRVT